MVSSAVNRREQNNADKMVKRKVFDGINRHTKYLLDGGPFNHRHFKIQV